MPLVPDGRPAGLARRALVRHLLATAARARRLRRHARSTTRSPTSSSPSCCTSRPRTRRRTSSSTSTRPGGVVYSGLAIYDTMRFIKPDVATICCGIAMSMGSLILAGGAAGKRSALPNSRILIHQPPRRLPGPGDRHPDPRQGGARAARRIEEIYAEHTGKPREEVSDDLERDRFFTPEQAADYGLDRPGLRLPQRERQRQRLLPSSSSSPSSA